VYHIYPDPGQVHLRADIAAFLATRGVGAEHVCCGCGSDEILDLVLRLFEPKGLVNLPPTFAMYPFLAKIAKVPVVTIDRTPAPHFALDFEAIEGAVGAGANLIFVASPNNPTGGMLTHEEVRRLTALNAMVVVDEAYAEFAPAGASAVSLVPTAGNLIVLRTFSKWAGLAGLRVGYSVSHPTVNAAFMGIKQPYNVNVAADAAARTALAHSGDIMTQQVGPMVRERDAMIAALTALGWLLPVPTVSNFVLLEVRARPHAGGPRVRPPPPSLCLPHPAAWPRRCCRRLSRLRSWRPCASAACWCATTPAAAWRGTSASALAAPATRWPSLPPCVTSRVSSVRRTVPR
jgi:histidinol-phosphate aminotransferase